MVITSALALALLLSVAIGISLGVLGGGGSILTVPILAYVLGMEPQQAITASLFVVAITSAVGMTRHAGAGRVAWRTGVSFGLAGMAGAFVGGLIGSRIPGVVLMVLFAAMMIVTSVAMMRSRREAPADGVPPHRGFRTLAEGFGVGFVTSLVGAGGGFLVVPALALLGGLPMAIAVGTSLLVIAMQSTSGLIAHLFAVSLDWPVVLAVTAAAVAGSFVGSALVGRIPEGSLRRGFGVFVLLMGLIVLAQEVPGLFT